MALITALTGLFGHPYLFALCVSILVLLVLSCIFATKWVKDRLPRATRIFLFLAIVVGWSFYSFHQADIYVKGHTPWCYAFFFSRPKPNGDIGGWEEGLGVAVANLDNASNVHVKIMDITDNSGEYDSSKMKDLPTISVIYSYKGGHIGQQVFTPLGHPYLAGAVDTGLTFDRRKLIGSTYSATVETDNGEDIQEVLRLNGDGLKWQCITVTRIIDGKLLINDYTPQFDPFGGRTLPVPCKP